MLLNLRKSISASLLSGLLLAAASSGFLVTARAQTAPALITPTPSSTLTTSTNLKFSWDPGVGATEFEFALGTGKPGADNLADVGPTSHTSALVPTIPGNGEPLYARLYYKLDGVWNHIDYTYSTFNAFEPYAGNPILPVTDISSTETLTGFASVVKSGSTYYMYFTYYNASGNFEIGLATSFDGLNWVADSAHNPVLTGSGIPNWDSFWVRVPNVWLEDGTWYMLYSGVSSTMEYRGGLATSTDGIHWTRSSVNNCTGTKGPGCVLDLGIQQGGSDKLEPCFGPMKVGNVYYLTYSSFVLPREIGMATSTDLTTWTKDPANPIFTGNRFCSDLFKYGSEYYLAVPHYTDGSNYSNFELYQDALPTFHPNDRTYLGIIKTPSATGFDDTDQDTPFVLTDDIHRDSYNLTGGDIWMYYSGATGLNQAKIWQEGLLISKMPSKTE